jgi:hypothetical protein
MNTGAQDANGRGARYSLLTSGNEEPLKAYGAIRRHIAKAGGIDRPAT